MHRKVVPLTYVLIPPICPRAISLVHHQLIKMLSQENQPLHSALLFLFYPCPEVIEWLFKMSYKLKMTSFVRIATIKDSELLSKTLKIMQTLLHILFEIFDDRYTTTAVNLDDVFGILLTIPLYFCGRKLHSIFQREYP